MLFLFQIEATIARSVSDGKHCGLGTLTRLEADLLELEGRHRAPALLNVSSTAGTASEVRYFFFAAFFAPLPRFSERSILPSQDSAAASAFFLLP